VVDEARGPVGAKGAVAWHLVDGKEAGAYRFRLGRVSGSAEVLLLPLDGYGEMEVLGHTASSFGLNVTYNSIYPLCRVATVFLFGPWVGAEVGIEQGKMRVVRDGQIILFPVTEVTQR